VQSLKSILDTLLRRYGIDRAIAQNKALIIWDEIVGASVAKNTQADRVEHGAIIVKVSSPVWRQELYFQKKEIIEKFDAALGKNVIRDIRFI